jgi:hypothetical protein
MNKLKLIVVTLAFMILATACVDGEKNKLNNRALDYWNYKINRQFNEAYQILSPGWRKTEDLKSFEQRMIISKARWLNAKFKNKECTQPDLCTVIMTIAYEYKFKTSGSKSIKVESDIKETWILKDNMWYHLPLDKKMSQK